MLASTIQFSNNTHHHTATNPHPTNEAQYVSTDMQQQEKNVPSQTPNSVSMNPTHPKAGKESQCSTQLSDRRTTLGLETALNAP
ncbi:hypothetical protein GCM10009551_107130 [Nocardiopsis tropica]|nr:hypothetical protein TTY48_00010 [Tsukamurella sp. TY48]